MILRQLIQDGYFLVPLENYAQHSLLTTSIMTMKTRAFLMEQLAAFGQNLASTVSVDGAVAATGGNLRRREQLVAGVVSITKSFHIVHKAIGHLFGVEFTFEFDLRLNWKAFELKTPHLICSAWSRAALPSSYSEVTTWCSKVEAQWISFVHLRHSHST